MKRIWIALALFVLAFSICALEMYSVISNSNKYISQLEYADKKMEKHNAEEAVSLCKKIENDWKKTETKMNIFLYHHDVDEITNSFAMLKVYAKEDMKSDFLSLSQKTKRQLLSLKESELPLLENIL